MTVHTKTIIAKGGFQNRRSAKTEVFKNAFERGDFWKRRSIVLAVWTAKTKVSRQRVTSLSYACVPNFHAHQTYLARVYGFWTPSMRIRTKKSSVHSKNSNKNVSLDLPFQCLVWTAENDVKRLVWTRIFLSVFWDPEGFENGGFRKLIRLSSVAKNKRQMFSFKCRFPCRLRRHC